jgi:hypothetical protein
MHFIIRADGRGRCIWLQENGGVVFDAGRFEAELAHIDQVRLAELLAAANDVDQLDSDRTAALIARDISRIIILILGHPAPTLREEPIFEVPTALAEMLASPLRLTVAEWIQRYPA